MPPVDPGYVPGPKLIPNCAMVRLNWSMADGKLAHNVLYAQWTGSPALSSSIANSIRTAVINGTNWTTFLALVAPAVSFLGVTLLDMRDLLSSPIDSVQTAIPGTSAGTAMPDETACVVTMLTGRRGPSGRGRAYIPGLSGTAMAAGGVISSAAMTAVQTWFATNVSVNGISTNLGTHSLGLPHRAAYTSPKTGRVFPERPATTVGIIQSIVKDNHWDSQRRRGLK